MKTSMRNESDDEKRILAGASSPMHFLPILKLVKLEHLACASFLDRFE